MDPASWAGVATGIGSLPHTDAAAAAEFALATFPELPAVPQLPRRHPHESMLAQAAVGIRGVTIESDGGLRVDRARLDPHAAVEHDLDDEAWGALRAFCSAAPGRVDAVKWQLTGPLTLGLALVRAGAHEHVAFEVAVRAIAERLHVVHDHLAARLPSVRQVVFLDEPSFVTLMCPGFPLPTDVALDVVSAALAALEPRALTGLHPCGDADLAAVLASGPGVLSVPATSSVLRAAGYLSRFLEGGGVIAWGAVPTDRPIGSEPDHWWRTLAGLWCDLVERGCDATRLRRQSMVTPACGLALHGVEQAAHVIDLTRKVATRVQEQAVATRLSLGA